MLPCSQGVTIQASNRSLKPMITDCHHMRPGVKKDSEVMLRFGYELHELVVTLPAGKPGRLAAHTEYLAPARGRCSYWLP